MVMFSLYLKGTVETIPVNNLLFSTKMVPSDDSETFSQSFPQGVDEAKNPPAVVKTDSILRRDSRRRPSAERPRRRKSIPTG